MELFERRRYYFCKYCGTFQFIEGPAGDGIQVLQRRGDGASCPLCTAPLARSLLDNAHAVQYCEKCRGVLIERPTFALAVQQRRARATGPGTPPAAVDRRELERRVTCPTCQTRMDVHPYYGPGNVVIDTCRQCDLVWLDFGELQQIDEAPGGDRGRPPRIAPPSPRPDAQLGGRTASVDAAVHLDVGAPAIDVLFDIFNS